MLSGWLAKKHSPFILHAIGLLLLIVVGSVDYITDDLAFLIFYIIPIAWGAWFAGRGAGILYAVISACTWTIVNAGYQPTTQVWWIGEKFIFLLLFAWVFSRLHGALAKEQELSRTDPLTGAMNRRCFWELAEHEMQRSGRSHRPMTLVYLDADNFKKVNDTLGHKTGDQLLQSIAAVLVKNLRKSDMVARLGGDEFVILLPETGFDAAGAVLEKIRAELLAEMSRHLWPVTFSIGAMSFQDIPGSFDEVVHLSDTLMYAVKESGKNAVRHELYKSNGVIRGNGLTSILVS